MFWRPDFDPHHEPHKVLIHKGDFVDESRAGRIVPFKVYYPVAHSLENLPVIIWSHGLGGSRDGAAFLARYIASHGYVVVNVQHVGTDTSIWEGKLGHPWDIIRAADVSRQDSLDRFNDVPFVLDQLPGFAQEHPDIGAHMDLDQIGMSGHSFGALTTQVMAGQPFPDKNENLAVMGDERFKCGILYSFVPMMHLTAMPGKDLYGPINIPLFFMTGTADDSPTSGQDYHYRMPVYEHAGCPEKHLLLLDEGDHMVFAGSRGKLAVHPKRKIHEDIIKVTSLAFWDAYLRNDEKAMEWLTGEGVSTYLNAEAKHEHRSL